MGIMLSTGSFGTAIQAMYPYCFTSTGTVKCQSVVGQFAHDKIILEYMAENITGKRHIINKTMDHEFITFQCLSVCSTLTERLFR